MTKRTLTAKRTSPYLISNLAWTNFLRKIRPASNNELTSRNGHCYDLTFGKYIGTFGNPIDNVYVGSAAYDFVDEKGNPKVHVTNISKLPITHTEFQRRAALVLEKVLLTPPMILSN